MAAYVNNGTAYAGIQVLSTAGSQESVRTVPKQLAGLYQVPVTCYGASWTALDSYNTPGKRWIDLLKAYLNLGLIRNRAAGGTDSITIARTIMSGATGWIPGNTGLVFVDEGGIEEIYGSPNSQPRIAPTFTAAVRASLLMLGSGTMVLAATYTRTGAWTFLASPGYLGGGYYYSTTNGNKFSFTANGPTINLGTLMYDGSTFHGKTFTITVDGVAYGGTYDPEFMATAGQWGLTNGAICPWYIELTGLSAGSHTVEVTCAAPANSYAGTSYFCVHGHLTPSATPPLVIVNQAVRLTAYADATEHSALNACIAAAASGLSYVVLCDLDTGFNPATMVGADNIHPNDVGEAFIVSRVLSVLGTVTTFPWEPNQAVQQ